MKTLITFLIPLAASQLALAQELAAPATAPTSAAATPVEVGGSVGETGDDYLPEAFRPDRHASTWMNSPFSREVLPPAAGPTGPTGPAEYDGWSLAAVDKFGGEYTVGMVSKKGEFFLLKVGQEHDKTDVKVTKVESNGVISETVIHVTDGSQSGTITFDTKRLTTASKGGTAPKNSSSKRGSSRPTSGRPQMTPQQAAAQQAAKKRAAAQLHTHLQQSANAQHTKQQQNSAAGNSPTTGDSNRPKRRAVVLPPSTR